MSPLRQRWRLSWRRQSILLVSAATVALLAAGCERFDYEGWLSKPLSIGLYDGEIPVMAALFDGIGPVPAVIDSGSPLIVLDGSSVFAGSGASNSQERTSREVRLLHLEQAEELQPPGPAGAGAGAGTGAGAVTRFIFRELDVWDLPLRGVGLDLPRNPAALIGAPLLQRFAVSISYAGRMLTLADEIPDSREQLADDCDHASITAPAGGPRGRCLAVLSTPRMGGGVAQIGEQSFELPATRLVVPLCLLPADFDTASGSPALGSAAVRSGLPAFAVVATGLGTSVISRSAFERLRQAVPSLTETAGSTLHLPSGKASVATTLLERVAAVADETREHDPCGELALRRRLLLAARADLSDSDKKIVEQDLALIDSKRINGASVALVKEAMTFAIVSDEEPLLQGLRQELRPAAPDIDVVLGGSFLRAFDLDLDYPASRIIMQCSEAGTGSCETLPFCAHRSNSDLKNIQCPRPPGR